MWNVGIEDDDCRDIMYKTPGYDRDILRPATLLKMPSKRMKEFFSKYFVSSSIFQFYFFPIYSQKNLKKGDKIFFEKHCHLRRILENTANFGDFEKISKI